MMCSMHPSMSWTGTVNISSTFEKAVALLCNVWEEKIRLLLFDQQELWKYLGPQRF